MQSSAPRDLALKYTFGTMRTGKRERQYFSTSSTWKTSFKENGSSHGASREAFSVEARGKIEALCLTSGTF